MNFIASDLGQTLKKSLTWYALDEYVKAVKVENFEITKSIIVHGSNEFFLAGKINPYLKGKIPDTILHGETLAVYLTGNLAADLGYDYLMSGDKFNMNLKNRLKTALLVQSICLLTNKTFNIK